MLECGFAEVFYRSLSLSFKAQCPHVVAQIQGYHLMCMWGRLVKFHGGGVVLKTILCARL